MKRQMAYNDISETHLSDPSGRVHIHARVDSPRYSLEKAPKEEMLISSYLFTSEDY